MHIWSTYEFPFLLAIEKVGEFSQEHMMMSLFIVEEGGRA